MSEFDQPQKPYKGLVPYSEEDAQYFFGRERECTVIIANSMASRLTLLYGPSGVGKSSLLRAGVGHALQNLSRQNIEILGTPEFIGITFSTWRDDPIIGLQKRVQESIERLLPTRSLDPTLSSSRLTEWLQAAAQHSDATLLITLDQFEEYFLYHPQEVKQGSFAHEFTRAVNSSGLAANFLISIREDALAKLDRFREALPNLFENYLRLDHLDRAAARAAIEKPIEKYNRLNTAAGSPFIIEPELTDEVLRQVEAEQPHFSGTGLGVVANKPGKEGIETPYLQMVMTRLWDEEWAAGSRKLRLKTLTHLGGAKRIVETHLDTAMRSLLEEEQRIAARIFHYLVTPSGTKIAHTASDLAVYSEQPPDKVALVLEKLASGDVRLLRTLPPPTDQPAADSRYEIFHDVLAPAVLDWRSRFDQKEKDAEALRIASKNVEPIAEGPSERLRSGMALSLSGGGYRAMLFHLGAIWRLNELGLLRKLARVSSVSGASITAGILGLRWNSLNFDATDVATNFEPLVVKPIRLLADVTIDMEAVLLGILLPWESTADLLAAAYRKHLYGHATLQDLPGDNEGPRFFLNATNVTTGVLWRFSKPYMGDYRLGLIHNPKVELATVVAASAATPPLLSPLELDLRPYNFAPGTQGDFPSDLTTKVLLTDGGVYDSMALETVWKSYDTVLISDGEGARVDERKERWGWISQTLKVITLIDSQVHSLRKRQAIAAYEMGLRKGTYWFMGGDVQSYAVPGALPCPHEQTLALAKIPTRLKKLEAILQEQIINWGYAVCDAAIRRHVDQTAPAPDGFPYPAAALG